MIRILTVAAAVALTAYVAPAHAQAASIGVRYGDLDLTSAEGHATLNARIDRAARNVCAAEDPRNLRQLMASNTCYRVALASAQPKLAALRSERTRAAG